MIIKPKPSDYEDMQGDPEDFEEVRNHPVKEEKPPKEPELSPEDPDFWEKDEGEFEHLRPMRDYRIWFVAGAVALVIGLLYALYLRSFTPYSEGAVQYGYVEQIEHRGDIFKTFEGVLLPYRSIVDTVAPYEGDFIFSAADDHIAAQLRRLQLANLPARVEYSRYRSAMPWRGESRILITHVDTADPAKIFPPKIPHNNIPEADKANSDKDMKGSDK